MKPALLLAGLLAAGLLVRAGIGTDALRAPGELGPLPFVALAALACAVGVPRQLAAYAGGLGFGVEAGIALALAAQLGGCAADYLWARLVARDWAARHSGRVARFNAALQRRPFVVTLTLRLLPVGSNLLLNLLAGVAGIAARPFLLASAIGFIPQTVVFALLGAGIRVAHGTQVALAVALFAASSALGLVLLRTSRVPQA